MLLVIHCWLIIIGFIAGSLADGETPCDVDGCMAAGASTADGATEGRPCEDLRCPCEKDYYFNTTTRTCQALPTIRRRRAVEGSSVGGFCSPTTACLDGLECSNDQCKCPEGCDYVPDLQACFCGTDHFSSLPLILVCIVWTPINLFIWYKGFAVTNFCKRRLRSRPKTPLHASLKMNSPKVLPQAAGPEVAATTPPPVFTVSAASAGSSRRANVVAQDDTLLAAAVESRIDQASPRVG
ncbi:uncharacterized protein LOC108670771 [Hyalella azteca]|uniref:Uncharacterized protein LOC108670771 n=1 Tax=Hyalella azteca TaxID=294128 RepID=A0A8B7NKD1_HYAAZ|nr:uncharacterized protein LOC108670771 [Hyalella azteca]